MPYLQSGWSNFPRARIETVKPRAGLILLGGLAGTVWMLASASDFRFVFSGFAIRAAILAIRCRHTAANCMGTFLSFAAIHNFLAPFRRYGVRRLIACLNSAEFHPN
jgi:hypothetical protein